MCRHFGTERVRGTYFNIVNEVWKKVGDLERILYFVIFALLIVVCQGLPVISPNRGNLSNSAISQAVVYLTKYGYLPASDSSTGNLRSDGHLKAAIATMQRFGNLEPTGLIDQATVDLMQRRRCGMPDVEPGGEYRVRRYAIQGQKWQSSNLTWSVESRESDSDIRMVRSQLRKAFEVWSSASALSFVEVREPSADILISFLKGRHGDGYPFDGEGSVLAHAFFPGEGIGGDAHFDAEERWLASQPADEDEGVNLFAVAAHEIGHSLGLSHSSTPGSLMFPYYQLMGEYFALPKDDADGIRHLYGFNDPSNQPTMPTITPTTAETAVTSTVSETVPTTKYHNAATTKKIKLSPRKTTLKPRKTTQVLTTPIPQMPDVCNTSIDAISFIRREVFVFKGKYFWRMNANRTVRAGYPVSIDRFWHALPADIGKIDALYERPSDTKIMFFTGKLYWLFSANQLEPGYPKPLTDLGLPQDLEHIDAATVWGHNGKTYFFSSKDYWKFDESEGRVELDYPRNIKSWRGVPADIDAAFQWTDGNTYFFKGTKFWKFIDSKMKVETKGPSDIGNFWFKCPTRTVDITELVTTPELPIVTEAHNTAATLVTTYFYLNILVVLLLLYFRLIFLVTVI